MADPFEEGQATKTELSMSTWIVNLLKNVPELRAIYDATRDEMTGKFLYNADAIVDMITSSSWYLENGPTVAGNIASRFKFGEKYYNQKVGEYKITISALARAMGLDVQDPGISDYLEGLAETSYLNGWDEAYIENTIVSNADIVGKISGGAYASQILDLNEYANTMGVKLSEQTKSNYQKRLIGEVGMDGLRKAATLDELKREIVNQQSLLYPMFSDDFAVGRTLWDVTALHRKKWADLLEVDEDTLDWNDPLWKDGKLFTQVDEKTGKVVARPVWDAEKLIKQDERWQYTENADRTYEKYGLNILNRFGFVAV
jgi:hypothetical protein